MTALRFRSFRLRLLIALLGLTAGAQAVAFAIIWRVHRSSAERELHHQLSIAANHFTRLVRQRTEDLTRRADALSWYEGLRQTLAATNDPETLRSALANSQRRTGADVAALLSLEGDVLAETRPTSGASETYAALFHVADAAEEARSTGYGWVGGQLCSLAVVPLRSPDVTAWIALGFAIDDAFLAELKASTGVDATLQRAGTTLASTHRPTDDDVAEQRVLPTVLGPPFQLSLHYSRAEKLAPARRLEAALLVVFAASLAAATLLALGVARGVSQPVQALAAHTERVAGGDYEARVNLARADEFGQLADSFNRMTAGLAERDRIRDLLDKNVSPEIAAQLLRDGAALGGEEREVTVLFSDLRGFSTLSEALPPAELVTLLNRYLDRMSAEVERHGGVIDKFIGDATMAIFGAPVLQPDSALRALRAAQAMEQALAALNAELAREGRPALGCGIGINTARVVAGNIGSQRRLNYSVIGDGVNVAARLQALTRTPEYRTNVILSQATRDKLPAADQALLRDLGAAQVKGRAEAVRIFAADPA